MPRHQDSAFRQRFVNGWMRQKQASRGEKNNSNVAFYFTDQSSISKTTAKALPDEIILPRQPGRRVSWAVFIEQSIYLGFCCKLFQYWLTILADTKSRNMKDTWELDCKEGGAQKNPQGYTSRNFQCWYLFCQQVAELKHLNQLSCYTHEFQPLNTQIIGELITSHRVLRGDTVQSSTNVNAGTLTNAMVPRPLNFRVQKIPIGVKIAFWDAVTQSLFSSQIFYFIIVVKTHMNFKN